MHVCTHMCVHGHEQLGGSGYIEGDSTALQILLSLMHCVTLANSITFSEPRFPPVIKYGVNCAP